tara:strand:+ start:1437 stop:1586 length:150 start_codon:yes stop_codon:yes gene_type:complete
MARYGFAEGENHALFGAKGVLWIALVFSKFIMPSFCEARCKIKKADLAC